MSKEAPRDQPETGKPLPHCKALLLCEKVTESQLTGKITLHNLIESFRLRAFPGRSTRFAVFLQLYDGIGGYAMSAEVNNLADGSSVAAVALENLDFPERLAKIELIAAVDFVSLPEPGRYEFVVLVDGRPLATQYFEAKVSHDDG